MIPEQARQLYAEQRALQARALRVLAAIWGDRAPEDFDAWFAANVDDMVAALTAAQTEAAGQGLDYVGAVLAEQGGDISPDVDVDPSPLVGVAGDGRALDSLLYGSVISARRAIARAPEVNLASIRDGWVNAGLAALTTRAQTVIADTSRVATGLGIISRPGVGYTRMLVGSSCSRCAILAGRVYGSKDGFDRHPRCDCRHVPARAADLEDRTVDARSYFESLTQSEQDRAFTVAGAQAIRDGADPAQVVNARRGAGLSFASGRLTNAELEAIRRGRPRAQVGLTTTEATTKRGWAGKRMRAEGTPLPRLMPEAIYQAGRSREEALEMLHKYGYTTGGLTRKLTAPLQAIGDGKPSDEWLKAFPKIEDNNTLSNAGEILARANDNIKAVNPRYHEGQEWQINCQRCAMALELRERGFRAAARPNRSPSPSTSPDTWSTSVLDTPPFDREMTTEQRRDLLRAWYPDKDGWTDELRHQVKLTNFSDLWRQEDGTDREFTPAANRDELRDALKDKPAGSRGWVTVRWPKRADGTSGGAHIYSWQVVERPAILGGGTELRWVDAQPGKNDVESYLYQAEPGSLRWMQTDDLVPTEAVAEMVQEGEW